MRENLPLALPQRPAGNYPEGNHKNQQHSTRTNGHKSLEHKSCVKVDAVQSTDAPGRSISKQFTVKQHNSADEVEA